MARAEIVIAIHGKSIAELVELTIPKVVGASFLKKRIFPNTQPLGLLNRVYFILPFWMGFIASHVTRLRV